MKKFLLLSLFVLLVASFTIVTTPSQQNDDSKVKVDFYFESLCPYCQQFIVGSLKTAAYTKDFWKICDFNLYPYGNARRVQNGTNWSFTCQHGVRQCQGNLIETCAIKKYDFYTLGLPFIICLESNSNDWIAQGKKCATQLNMDWNAINNCATSNEGVNYILEMAKATEILNPPHTYVPWVVVNNKHDTNTQQSIERNMVKYVCSIYKGPEKIAACQ